MIWQRKESVPVCPIITTVSPAKLSRIGRASWISPWAGRFSQPQHVPRIAAMPVEGIGHHWSPPFRRTRGSPAHEVDAGATPSSCASSMESAAVA